MSPPSVRPRSRGRPLPGPALIVLLATACSTPEAAGQQARPVPRAEAPDTLEAARRDQVSRIAERLARSDRLGAGELFLEIERLMPAWQMEQRHGRARPIEQRLTEEVVAHFDLVLGQLQTGVHDRRLVAAWALGFSRVPDNDMGVASPHERAVAALLAAMDGADDEVMRNIMVALWRIASPSTPSAPLLEVLERHHDPETRANAALALAAVLTPATAPRAIDVVAAALNDAEPKVRLHAANVAQLHPDPAYTRRLVGLLPSEPMSLVRAGMAAALAQCRDPSVATVLVPLLDSGEPIESAQARAALTRLLGVDRGPHSGDWADLVPR